MRELPKFPTELLPKFLQDYIKAISEENQTPEDTTALMCLATLSAASRGVWDIKTANRHTEALALYCAAIMESGERKSPIMDVPGPILMMEREAIKIWSDRWRGVNKIRLDAQRKRAKAKLENAIDSGDSEAEREAFEELKMLQEPNAPKYVVNDSTPEAFGKIMAANHGTISVFDAEGTLFKILGGRYSGGKENLELINRAYSGDYWSMARMDETKNITMPLPFMSIGILIQPEIVQGLNQDTFTGSGFLPRFLFAIPKSLIGYRKVGTNKPKAASDEVINEWKTRIEKLHSEATTIRDTVVFEDKANRSSLVFTPEAQLIFDKFEDDFEVRRRPGGDLGDVTKWANKLPGTLARVVALIALGNGEREYVGVEYAVMIRELAEYFIAHAKAVWDSMRGVQTVGREEDEKKHVIIKWIKNNAKKDDKHAHVTKTFTASEIYQQVRYWKDGKSFQMTGGRELVTSTLNMLMNEATNKGSLWLVEHSEVGIKTGRPTTRYIVDLTLMKTVYPDGA